MSPCMLMLMHIIRARARIMALVSDHSRDFLTFNYFSVESPNIQIKSQIESQCFKLKLCISNRIAKMVQIVIRICICPSLQHTNCFMQVESALICKIDFSQTVILILIAPPLHLVCHCFFTGLSQVK